MKSSLFGVLPDGSTVEEYTLQSGKIACKIITYGGILRSLTVPNECGDPVDVVLGFDSLEDYQKQDKYIGALIGRYANRIGRSEFTLGEQTYSLCSNDGQNHLHGGLCGFDKQVWSVKAAADDMLELTLHSPDGQEGYPGNLQVNVTYRLVDQSLVISYSAVSDRDTLCNLTNHAYFNLSGHDSGIVDDHTINICADYYTPTDKQSIPVGLIQAVDDTPMDMRAPIRIGDNVNSAYEQIHWAGGYDHNWVISGEIGDLRLAAVAHSSDTGITMKTHTTQPSIQFYTGNYLDGCPIGKNGAKYGKRSGFCLETQCYPDAPHHTNFPPAMIKASEVYHHVTVYSFG